MHCLKVKHRMKIKMHLYSNDLGKDIVVKLMSEI